MSKLTRRSFMKYAGVTATVAYGEEESWQGKVAAKSRLVPTATPGNSTAAGRGSTERVLNSAPFRTIAALSSSSSGVPWFTPPFVPLHHREAPSSFADHLISRICWSANSAIARTLTPWKSSAIHTQFSLQEPLITHSDSSFDGFSTATCATSVRPPAE